jgi:hypothetical protein
MDYVDMDFAAAFYEAVSEDTRQILKEKAEGHIRTLGFEPTETLTKELAVYFTQQALNDYAAIEEALGGGE